MASPYYSSGGGQYNDGSMTTLSYDDPPEPGLEDSVVQLRDDGQFVTLKDEQFPLELSWIKDFERGPDSPLKKSFRNGLQLGEVDRNAPTIRIAITFMAGADKPSVAQAEMSKLSDKKPIQKTPSWRVHTAAALLQKFSFGDDLNITRRDGTADIVTNWDMNQQRLLTHHKHRKSLRESRSPSDDDGPQPQTLRRGPTREDSQSLIKRNIYDNTLTIDSESVHLIHGVCPPDHDSDLTCTLVEIDMFSLRDLMQNYRVIVSSGGKSLSAKEILFILDTMINDVRRLCTRSPRLFRMSTRSLIAKSTDTRYGVDYGNMFVTLNTSEGIRKLVEKSSAYYLSLNDSKIDQDFVRPKFLQMLVLLLSLLNDTDLEKIRTVLESTYEIPGDRANLELLIMKVIPLGSINSQVFLEGLFEAYKPEETKASYIHQLQNEIWEELQQELAEQGYLVPALIELPTSAGVSRDFRADDDLELLLQGMDLNSGQIMSSSIPHRPLLSWLAKWPNDGVKIFSVFKYLQHDGQSRNVGSVNQGTLRAINEIPHLEIGADDSHNSVQVELTDKRLYRVSAEESDLISNMQGEEYVLKSTTDETIHILRIRDDILNRPFIKATRQINKLVNKMKSFFTLQEHKKKGIFSSSTKSYAASFSNVDEPAEACIVRAEVISGDGDHECVAVAFKVSNKIVYREDVLRQMNQTLSHLTVATERLDKELKKLSASKNTDESAKARQNNIDECRRLLAEIESLMVQAQEKKSELQRIRVKEPEDPITRVVWPSLEGVSGDRPEWQGYKIQLRRPDKKQLIVQGSRMVVDSVEEIGSTGQKIGFQGFGKVTVEPLVFSATEVSLRLVKKNIVLWLGYYLVLVEPVEGIPQGHTVLGYFKVQSQEKLSVTARSGSGTQNRSGPQLSVLV